MAPLASDPDISPDGKRVAFATYLRNTWQIAVADLTGANFTLIGEGVQPAWSPDGTRLAFVRTLGGTAGWFAKAGRAHIFTVDPTTGTNLVQITSGEFDNITPEWAPDGSAIVFSSNRAERRARGNLDARTLSPLGEFDLYLVRPDGTGLVQLTSGTAINIEPEWGRDGWIYFSSNQAGNYDIWKLRPPALETLGQ